MNGGRTEYNNWELDGGDNMDNGSNGTLNVYPSIDAIAEFKVLTSNYGAQYGRNGSGTVEVETKSGTKAFHGDAYEFVRNDAFNAQNYFNDTGFGGTGVVPPYKKNDFGYTIGGPVYIPRFTTRTSRRHFSSGRRSGGANACRRRSIRLVPYSAERTGNFSDVCPRLAIALDFARLDPRLIPATGQSVLTNQLMVAGRYPERRRMLLVAADPGGYADPGRVSLSIPTSPLPTSWREELISRRSQHQRQESPDLPLHPRFLEYG